MRSVSRGGGVGVGGGERVESVSKDGVLTRLGRGCLLLACLLASSREEEGTSEFQRSSFFIATPQDTSSLGNESVKKE